MKKYLALFIGMLFVLGFAATAFAIHAEIPSETQAVIAKGATQITLGGEIRVRGEFKDNVVDFNNDLADRSSAWDQRVRFSVEAKVTPNTIGMIQLESGNADNNDNVTWGTYEANGATGLYKVGNAKHGDVRILQAWIQHSGSGLLGVPALLKIGHMPIKLGWGLFLDHTKFGDDALLLGVDPIKNMHIIAHTIKFKEGEVTKNDDANAYGLIFAYDFDKNTNFSADVTYVDNQKFAGTGPIWTDLHLYNFGFRGAATVANFGIKADVEIQTGKVKNATDVDLSGWAVMAGISYKIAPVKLSADFAMGSGDDNPNDTKVKTFITTLGKNQNYTYVYEYRTATAGTRDVSGGLANTMYVKIGANADLAKDLNADLNLYYLRASKKMYGAPGLTTATATDSKNIGTEVDAKITYTIDKNLQYWVEGGYLFAGNYWKVVTAGKNPDDAYAIRHGIQLNF